MDCGGSILVNSLHEKNLMGRLENKFLFGEALLRDGTMLCSPINLGNLCWWYPAVVFEKLFFELWVCRGLL